MKTLLVATLLVAILLAFSGCASIARRALFYPTHHNRMNGLSEWRKDGALIGYSRMVPDSHTVWLMMHGNGGQAADRAYALHAFSERDSVYILEYPGYGARAGKPSKQSFDQAALEAYQHLRRTYPARAVCVVGESIGTGPASLLARQATPPVKIVLIVPFDNLESVAAEHLPWLPVTLILGSSWDNVEALADYKGPVDIFAARDDAIIPMHHAEALARAVPHARLRILPGGHNDWALQGGTVQIRNP
jgi:pimeloyl-ACP methyl ester carboxylesterase